MTNPIASGLLVLILFTFSGQGGIAQVSPAKSGGESVKAPAKPVPKFKNEEAAGRFQEGMELMKVEEFVKARSIFRSCLKDAETTADRKILSGLVEDTRLGVEFLAAKKLFNDKNEKAALVKAQRALKRYPDSSLVPDVKQFMRECEELIFIILDDFEPGGSLEKVTKRRKENAIADPSGSGSSSSSSSSSSGSSSARWNKSMSFNDDPRFVRHGKGSMKWRVGGDGYSSYYYGRGYESMPLKNPITGRRYIVFSVFLPEADEGALRVMLSPEDTTSVARSLYTLKFIEFRKRLGWLDVRLDLRRDFGGTRFVKLEDVRYVRIDYMHLKYRTIYLDFVHFE